MAQQLSKLKLEVDSQCGNPPCEIIIPAGATSFVLIESKKRGVKVIPFSSKKCLDEYQSSRSGIPRLFKDLLATRTE